ncbi:MAG: heme-binding domain-containing protein [Acidobacteria bacterium]|nr:heme-binding domain-containing protein [Acidobacteriota bacterium]
MNRVKTLSTILIALLIAIQFVQPARTNPPADPARAITRRLQVDPEVARILDRACRDCHSNDTRWPWYSRVAPGSWLVIDHVNHGRRHLNFSDWPDDATEQEKLSAICSEVTSGRMPVSSYTLVHRNARIESQDARRVCEWATREQQALNVTSPR